MNSIEIVDQTLALAVEYVHGAQVEGDIAEFGVMDGRTACVMARSLKAFGSYKKLHLFDSFRGLPEPTSQADLESVHVKTGTWEKGACCGGSAEEVGRRICELIPGCQVVIHAGWFKDTLRDLNSPLAMLHIDCDFYQSARDVLHWVFSHILVSDGAIILFDDWNCNQASPDRGERLAWKLTVNEYSVRYSDEGSYGWAGHKFIVHSNA